MKKARTACLYGNGGAGKTTQLYFMAKWLWEKYQLRSRLISFDGKYEQFQLGSPSLIESGAVELIDVSSCPTALATVKRLAEGYWPRTTKTGAQYFKPDKNCETKDWEKVGAYLIDGLTAWGDLWLVHASDQAIGFKASWEYQEDEYTFHGSQDGHYNVVQRELLKTVKQGFNQLPVRYVMFTALVEKGIENYRRKRVKRGDPNAPAEPNITTLYGPKVAGQALTPFVPSWFCDTFHVDDVEIELKEGGTKKIKAAYYETHLHETTDVPFLARVDILPEDVERMREKFKGGFIPLGFRSGINKFYDWIESTEKRGVV